jgi:signal transduction histidine kinase
LSGHSDLAAVAHEAAAPVAAICALAELAVTTRGAVDWPRFVALVSAAVRDLERILGDPELRSLVVEDVAVDELLRSAAAQGGERVSVADATGVVVHGDPTRLRQALANLVRNALRHGEHVWLEVEVTPEWVAIDVVDDGPGVDPAVDLFARGASGVASTGYGLWLAQGIATAHGGRLELVPGQGGARFRLSLPSSDVGR